MAIPCATSFAGSTRPGDPPKADSELACHEYLDGCDQHYYVSSLVTDDGIELGKMTYWNGAVVSGKR